jgi:hypothetical protein
VFSSFRKTLLCAEAAVGSGTPGLSLRDQWTNEQWFRVKVGEAYGSGLESEFYEVASGRDGSLKLADWGGW